MGCRCEVRPNKESLANQGVTTHPWTQLRRATARGHSQKDRAANVSGHKSFCLRDRAASSRVSQAGDSGEVSPSPAGKAAVGLQPKQRKRLEFTLCLRVGRFALGGM